MDCCVLSSREVGRLMHYGLLPNHAEHYHIDPRDAMTGIQNDRFELIQYQGRDYVTQTKVYFLQRKPSAGIDVIQRVLSNHVLELKPLR
jgi:hypothetical protein